MFKQIRVAGHPLKPEINNTKRKAKDMTLIIVNRNGAKNHIEMARELAKHTAFKLTPLSEVIKTLRVYEREGNLILTECFITLKHYC